ncbi:MAG: AI-2E family transporter [Nitrospirota bacterium]
MDRPRGTGTPLPAMFYVILGIFLFGGFIYLLRPVLTPFVLAFILAYILNPVVDALERRRVPRIVSVILLVFLAGVAVAAAALFLVPIIESEIRTAIARGPVYLETVQTRVVPWIEETFSVRLPHTSQEWGAEISRRAGAISTDLAGTLGSAVAAMFSGILSLVLGLVGFLVVPVVAVYLLKDFNQIGRGLLRFLPERVRPTAMARVQEINAVLSGFVRGQLLVCLILSVLYSAGFLLVGLDLAVVVGLLAGFANIVPYMGLATSLVMGGTLAFLQYQDSSHVLMALAVAAVVQVLEGTVISPRIVGQRIGLHPVAVIFAILAGGQLFGFLGILLAVPAAAVAGVLLRAAASRFRETFWFRGAA